MSLTRMKRDSRGLCRRRAGRQEQRRGWQGATRRDAASRASSWRIPLPLGRGPACLARMQAARLSRMLDARRRNAMNETTPIDPAPRHPCASASRRPAGAPRRPDGKIGVLLVNLGTPDAADAAGVRRYLKEFLSDPRVIENQGADLEARAQRRHPADPAAAQGPRLPARSGTPSRTNPRSRPSRARRPRSSPRRSSRSGRHLMVDWAMRYGNPSIASRLEALVGAGLRAHPGDAALSAIFAPPPPRPSATRCSARSRACASSRRCASRAPYYDDPVYIEALASSTSVELAQARVRARGHPGVVPRHPAGLRRQGRSLL